MALPAATIEEGVLGLEGLHDMGGGVILNDRASGTFPRYVLDRISGLHDRADSADEREDVQGHSGEIPRPSPPRGKTVVYEGRVQGRTLPELRVASQKLRWALSDTNNELPRVTRPPAARGGVEWLWFARSLACTVDDEQTRRDTAVPYPWQRTFMVSLRMGEAKFAYGGDPESIASGNGVGQVVHNDGNAPADPVITVWGPLVNPVTVERYGGSDGDRALVFDNALALAAINAGKALVLTFGRQPTAVCPQIPGADFAPAITFASNWWDDQVDGLKPGDNNVRVTGCDSWSISWRHTSL